MGPWAAALLVCGLACPVAAEESARVVRGEKGIELSSGDGRYFANVDLRVQLRETWSEVETPAADGEDTDTRDDLQTNRARVKIGGHAGAPWLTYYYEHDVDDGRLLDLRVTLERWDAAQLRFGQWKIPFNRERIDSSGNQQLVDRSIATPAFTLDRQRGAAIMGHLFQGTRGDAWYNVGLFEPLGRDSRGGYEDPLVLGRWQWNFLGRDLAFSQSDTALRSEAAASIAMAAARYRGPYTSFSSSGGGQLDGFVEGRSDRYRVEQWMVETAWQYRGLSWQQEWHAKTVDDTLAGRSTTLRGGYAQAGFFPHAIRSEWPRPLELALRYARVDPDDGRSGDVEAETTLGLNWFFEGHRNKLSADLSWLDDALAAPGRRSERRLRLQWDFSL
jgi:phosphate-selective porin